MNTCSLTQSSYIGASEMCTVKQAGLSFRMEVGDQISDWKSQVTPLKGSSKGIAASKIEKVRSPKPPRYRTMCTVPSTSNRNGRRLKGVLQRLVA